MEIFSHSSIKRLVISTCVLSMAMACKLSVPVVSEIVVSDIPLIYSFVISYLKPPYLYLLINCIIITIAATSKLQYKLDDDSSESVTPKIVVDLQTDFVVVSEETKVSDHLVSEVEVRPEFGLMYSYDTNVLEVDVVEPEEHENGNVGARVSELETTLKLMNGTDAEDGAKSSWPPPIRHDSIELLASSEKTPLSARFGQSKSLKASTTEAGKALRVSKPKRQDTLENTWKTITEGRSMPLTRHHKKSDSWETRHTATTPPQTINSTQKMKKSETFNDRTSTTTSNNNSSSLRKEPSPSQDELNRRVEAFINKMNKEMRIQRQESLNRYNEMIKRGAN